MQTPASLVAAGALLALAACATGPRARDRQEPAACEAAFDHVEGVLGTALDQYVEGMRRYAAARDAATTARAEARVRQRATEWSAAHREPFRAECARWHDATFRCVMSAPDPRVVSDCGLEPIVRSFTDEVLPAFGENPLDSRPAGFLEPGARDR